MEVSSASAEVGATLRTVPYDETSPSKAPIRGTSSTSLRNALESDQPSKNSPTSLDPRSQNGSGYLRAASSARGSQTSLNNTSRSPNSLKSLPSIPQIQVDEEPTTKKNDKKWLSLKATKSTTEDAGDGEAPHKISLDIPTGGLGDELQSNNLKFSNRGSMLLDGKKTNEGNNTVLKRFLPVRPSTIGTASRISKALSTEEEMLSYKVRSFYAHGSEIPEEVETDSTLAQKIGLRWQDALGAENASVGTLSRGTSATDINSVISIQHSTRSRSESVIQREENELAGGIEDWQDIDGAALDRYGFIIPKSETGGSSSGLNRNLTIRDTHSIQRVSSSLQLAAETPRRKYTIRRTPSSAHGSAPGGGNLSRSTSQHSKMRPTSSQSAYVNRQSATRAASNRLPQNKDRKLLDDAGDMMTLPRTTRMYVENGQIISDDKRARRKEIEREEKWRKMAKPVSNGSLGGGMTFEFDVNSPKVIERTWKGIPDKWRATAWHAFLSASAKKRKNYVPDDELIGVFHQYQEESSPDDVQIDIDVPRTINSHIMFRRRYRGGQRLLFRVLHAMSLHFAETGYVQGMAALAATLLAYYEEEKAFVMLVRMWELRGLEKLYRSGFAGLMAALNDFEKQWLGQGELAKKLDELGVGPTAYGTKWYLTLFNYSIPFPAQLRVWDVFMLLGDDAELVSKTGYDDNDDVTRFGTTLDVLHATSAALIDGMRDILLGSDFENAMKVLTSWIPIQDDDLFMRVAKTEWKMHKKKIGTD